MIWPSKSNSTVQLPYAVPVVLRIVTSPLKPLPQSLVTANWTAVVGVGVEAGTGGGAGAGSLLRIVTMPLWSAIVARVGDERLIEKVSFGS